MGLFQITSGVVLFCFVFVPLLFIITGNNLKGAISNSKSSSIKGKYLSNDFFFKGTSSTLMNVLASLNAFCVNRYN